MSWIIGRRSAWVVIVLWLAIAAALSPLAFQLPDAQRNDAAAFLPSDAESTRLLAEQRHFPGGDAVPTIVVLDRPGGLTNADRAAAARIGQALRPFASGPVLGPVPSPHNRTLILTVPLAQRDDASAFTDDVREMRRVARPLVPPGAQIAITGPAGLVADAFHLFSTIETLLLLVTATIVAVILLVVYRSPFLWLVPLISVGIADQTAAGIVYLLARHTGLTVNGQSSGILRVLVFGAGTDYALLLIARYREELTRHRDPRRAMREAVSRAGPAILASAGTVIIGMLCLLFGLLASDRGLGPVGAIGISTALITMMTLLPAALVLCGRRLFWPRIPHFGEHPPVTDTARRGPAARTAHAAALAAPTIPGHEDLTEFDLAEEEGRWVRISAAIDRRPRTVWVLTSLLLGALAIGLLAMDTSLRQDEGFRHGVESVRGIGLASADFPPGATAPTYVIVDEGAARATAAILRGSPEVAASTEVGRTGGKAQFLVVLRSRPDSPESFAAVSSLRERLHGLAGAQALVGGNTAVNLDVRRAAERDRQVIIPMVLAVVLVVLVFLLRAVVAPLLLMATVVLSYLAALGASAVAYRWLFGFPGSDPSLPLFAFIFLVALGVDYNIFLMTRVREETARIGSRPGVLHALAVTGGVITSAGVVLAATFSALVIFPLVQLAEVGFVVAFGVLLDTLVVRSILVPALALDIGRAIWWPGRLARANDGFDAGGT
ncbi:putative membrane protein ActII-3 [Frankia canadensis]|uniref:Putative membrane protein ActII-3 n=1 Tax=Frankia canadensis TaxID=1836972 RepID=A0A2I2KX49_9ACTN|nr:MMPL family transporter [Frankia canadensis]SNQ50226.1 putative membrane protein ActII-3 [Frankia canadensis]SOU57516.1 putative membrane protein ActII-3 [Frankia canadensis]